MWRACLLIIHLVALFPPLGLAPVCRANGTGRQEEASVEERYAAMQAAFLQEDFERVAVLAGSASHEERLQPLAAAQGRMSLWHALSLERLQRSREALGVLDALHAQLAEHPELPESARLFSETLFWDGEISRRAQELVRARRAYHRLLTQFPRSIWRTQAQVGLGFVLFQQQAYQAAREQVQEAARGPIESPVVQEAVLLEGLCLLKLARYDEAQRLFHTLLAQPLTDEMRWQVSLYLSEAFIGLDRVEDALAGYRQLIASSPSSSWSRLARFGIGWTLFQQQRYRESLDAFKDYVTSLPSAARQRADMPWRGRAEAGKSDELATARRVTEEACAQLWFAQGRCLMELGDEEAALAHFETLARVFPNHPRSVDTALSHSELLERRDRLGEARAVVERVTPRALTPLQRQHVQLRLATLDLAVGHAQEASARLRAVQDEARTAEVRQAAFNGLGDAALFLGNDQEAASWYEQAEQIEAGSPSGRYAAYQQGRLLLKAGRLQEAVERFQDVSELWNARLALALAHLLRGEPDVAREALRRAVQTADNSRQAARVDYYLALLAVHDGDVEEAKRLCRDISLRAPRSDEAFEAQLLLADLLAAGGSWETSLISLQPLVDAFDRLALHRRGALAIRLGHLARQADSYAMAIRWYEAAWPLVPSQQGELDYRIASCYEEAGDWEAATNRYRTIRQAPWNIRGRLAAAKLLERAAQWQDARRLYQSVVHQAVPEAKIAQERLIALGVAEAEHHAE